MLTEAKTHRIGYDPKLNKFTQAQLQRDTQAVLSGKKQIKVVRKGIESTGGK